MVLVAVRTWLGMGYVGQLYRTIVLASWCCSVPWLTLSLVVAALRLEDGAVWLVVGAAGQRLAARVVAA